VLAGVLNDLKISKAQIIPWNFWTKGRIMLSCNNHLHKHAISYLPTVMKLGVTFSNKLHCSLFRIPYIRLVALPKSRSCWNSISKMQNICSTQQRIQPKSSGGARYFEFKRATVLGLGHRLAKYKTSRYAWNFAGPWPIWPPCLRLWCKLHCLIIADFCWIELLPDEIFLKIFGYIDSEARVLCSQVSWRWNRMA